MKINTKVKAGVRSGCNPPVITPPRGPILPANPV